MPQDAYGWEKLVTERLCIHYREDYGLETRIVRFHNIFGPQGTWDGGREKAPAAMCRKVADRQTHRGNRRSRSGAMASRPVPSAISTIASRGSTSSCGPTIHDPLNLGQDRMVTINQLADMAARSPASGVKQEARGRPAGRARSQLRQHASAQGAGMGAGDSLEEGLARTYAWIESRSRPSWPPTRPPRAALRQPRRFSAPQAGAGQSQDRAGASIFETAPALTARCPWAWALSHTGCHEYIAHLPRVPAGDCAGRVNAEEMAQDLAKAGHRVTVVTGWPNHPKGVLYAGWRACFRQMEHPPGGYRVLRRGTPSIRDRIAWRKW